MNTIETKITMTSYITNLYTSVIGWWNPPHKALAPVYDADTEDNIYEECPHANFCYDMDMYLANDRYAEMIDGQIAEENARRDLFEYGQFVTIVDLPYTK